MIATRGTVYLVGAGPGDPGLITVHGYSLLTQADVVIHDRLIPHELLAAVRPDAEIIDVGKAPGKHPHAQTWINAMLVARALDAKSVVRLKGGDPFVFGRGYEELHACRVAGVPCMVVPGVSSAIAGPGAAGIPVTHRGLVRSVAIITATVAEDDSPEPLDYRALANMDTVVILMGRTRLEEVATGLLLAGKSPECPAACIQNATTPEQRVVWGSLNTIAARADLAGLESPVVTVIGPVASLGRAEITGFVRSAVG
jgi:uroporphyrin-III C-methyltransferase